MKRGYFSSLSRLSVAMAGTFMAGAAHAGIYSYLGTADAPSTVVTTQGVLQTAANQLTTVIENRLRQARNPQAAAVTSFATSQGAGFSAGDPLTGFTVWANAAYDHLDNDLSSTAYEGHVTTAIAGFDTVIEGFNAVAGLAVGWENQNFDTSFNNGTQDADGWSIIPYAAFSFCNEWALALLVGYESLSYTLNRQDPLVTLGFDRTAAPTAPIVGEPRGNRYFGAAELTYQRFWCDWDFGAQTALLYLHETTGGYDEVTNTYSVFNPKQEYHLARFKLGGTVGYFLTDMIEPYVRAAFLWDFSQTDIVVAPVQPFPANSDTAGLFGVGLNVFSTDCVVFNVDLYTEQFRDDFKHWGFLANFRVSL